LMWRKLPHAVHEAFLTLAESETESESETEAADTRNQTSKKNKRKSTHQLPDTSSKRVRPRRSSPDLDPALNSAAPAHAHSMPSHARHSMSGPSAANANDDESGEEEPLHKE
jgi:hypothetical protein